MSQADRKRKNCLTDFQTNTHYSLNSECKNVESKQVKRYRASEKEKNIKKHSLEHKDGENCKKFKLDTSRVYENYRKRKQYSENQGIKRARDFIYEKKVSLEDCWNKFWTTFISLTLSAFWFGFNHQDLAKPRRKYDDDDDDDNTNGGNGSGSVNLNKCKESGNTIDYNYLQNCFCCFTSFWTPFKIPIL